MSVLNEALPLKDYDEDRELARIEVRKNGYFISSLQNTAFVDFDGKILYNNNFKEAGLSKGVRGLMKGVGYAASAYSAASGLQWLRARPMKDQNGKDIANHYELYKDESSAAYKRSAASDFASAGVFEMANKRNNATKDSKDAIFILTNLEGISGLVKVDKDSGKTLASIPFGDKDPAYIIDEAENKLYVVIKDKFVQGYNLNK